MGVTGGGDRELPAAEVLELEFELGHRRMNSCRRGIMTDHAIATSGTCAYLTYDIVDGHSKLADKKACRYKVPGEGFR